MYKSRENVFLHYAFLMGILLDWEDVFEFTFFHKTNFLSKYQVIKGKPFFFNKYYYLTDTFSVDSDAFLQEVIYFCF